MFGAAIGDMYGKPYEFDELPNPRSMDIVLENNFIDFTDDTVMTCAVADALLELQPNPDTTYADARLLLIEKLKTYGNKYKGRGYGGSFYDWLTTDTVEPYNSWGNGSAMRVSAAGWLFDTLSKVRAAAKFTAEVTHNHPEGIKGAEAIASCIFLARKGYTKYDIKTLIEKVFGYDLSRTIDNIKKDYTFDVSCQGSVPEAIIAYLEGNNFEEVLKKAISLGGDTDTIAAMACSIAEASYTIPTEYIQKAQDVLPLELWRVLHRVDTGAIK